MSDFGSSAHRCDRCLIRCRGPRPASPCGFPRNPTSASTETTTRSTPRLVGRRVEVRAGQRAIVAVSLDTGELIASHHRCFAGAQTFTDPAHQAALDQLRGERRRPKQPEVEIRPLARSRRADPSMSKTSELTHLFRTLKAPAAARALPKLAERAREESWSHERFLEAVLASEVSSRESHGGEARIKAARFPARKTLEEFDFSFQRSVKRQVVEHLGQLDFLHGKENVVLLGPTGHRQDPPRGRDRDQGMFGGPASRLRHRNRVGRPPRRRHSAPEISRMSLPGSGGFRC